MCSFQKKTDVIKWSHCYLWCFKNTLMSLRRQTCISNQQGRWKHCRKFLKSCQVAMIFVWRNPGRSDFKGTLSLSSVIFPVRGSNPSRTFYQTFWAMPWSSPMTFFSILPLPCYLTYWSSLEKFSSSLNYFPSCESLTACGTEEGFACGLTSLASACLRRFLYFIGHNGFHVEIIFLPKRPWESVNFFCLLTESILFILLLFTNPEVCSSMRKQNKTL